ncbi:kinase domain-containing protein [Aspergillus sclerotiicarbonarius CBS 121057]|uniref:non-specific serine/threonine protein kinase n=1 Tax=Aspergillus sclerotiicarbonarius (strain CBS 121057 / IBT 28362) TaxID=1448318 RepID=A0A319ET69_ASPSB|nr:kinase domain-containing protein [Aspergillus sclerotiicarbonarius CBS 121057]
MASTTRSPRQFPKTGFVKLESSEVIEEEDLPSYNVENFYPVYIGQVFNSRYQVVSKLGYGASSTVWLCRDLHAQSYMTLKVCVQGLCPRTEIAVSEQLTRAEEHFGEKLIRLFVDSFEVVGPSNGKHMCLVYQPLGMSFTEFQKLLPNNRFPKELAQEDEIQRPIARKVLKDREIYYSRPMPTYEGLPVLADLGEARQGQSKHQGDIMPGIYRAPEVILGMDWDSKVDVWSIGTLAWDLINSSRLIVTKINGVLNDEQHLAEMVSLMGPPPAEFLSKSQNCSRYWDDKGNWKGSIPIPDQSFEKRLQEWPDDDRRLFVSFLRKIFKWVPDDRPTAEELAFDELLMQPVLAARRD